MYLRKKISYCFVALLISCYNSVVWAIVFDKTIFGWEIPTNQKSVTVAYKIPNPKEAEQLEGRFTVVVNIEEQNQEQRTLNLEPGQIFYLSPGESAKVTIRDINLSSYWEDCKFLQPQDVKEDEMVVGYESYYENLRTVSKKFFSEEKSSFIVKRVHVLLTEFKKEYEQENPYTFNVTNLSARARIYILTEVIRYKLSKFDKTVKYNKYWKVGYTDSLPTKFKIGVYEYLLKLTPTKEQPGYGRLSGFTKSPGRIDLSYEEMLEQKYKTYIINHKKDLLEQKKDGVPIKTGDEKKDRFLNGFNLLLDYEVAKRLIPAGIYAVIPRIICIPYMEVDIENFLELILQKNSSVVAGSKRGRAIRGFIYDRSGARSLGGRGIRNPSQLLHKQDEVSGDEDSDMKLEQNKKRVFSEAPQTVSPPQEKRQRTSSELLPHKEKGVSDEQPLSDQRINVSEVSANSTDIAANQDINSLLYRIVEEDRETAKNIMFRFSNSVGFDELQRRIMPQGVAAAAPLNLEELKTLLGL